MHSPSQSLWSSDGEEVHSVTLDFLFIGIRTITVLQCCGPATSTKAAMLSVLLSLSCPSTAFKIRILNHYFVTNDFEAIDQHLMQPCTKQVNCPKLFQKQTALKKLRLWRPTEKCQPLINCYRLHLMSMLQPKRIGYDLTVFFSSQTTTDRTKTRNSYSTKSFLWRIDVT